MTTLEYLFNVIKNNKDSGGLYKSMALVDTDELDVDVDGCMWVRYIRKNFAKGVVSHTFVICPDGVSIPYHVCYIKKTCGINRVNPWNPYVIFDVKREKHIANALINEFSDLYLKAKLIQN